MDLDEVLAATFSLVAPHLTERQRRLLSLDLPKESANLMDLRTLAGH
jgi:hypothetical protein